MVRKDYKPFKRSLTNSTTFNEIPSFKLTHQSSKENISFLDLNVKLSEGQLKTDLYIKPTDRHQGFPQVLTT